MAQVQSEADVVAGSEGIVGRSPRELIIRRFKRDRFAIGGIVFLVFMILVAIFAPLIAKLLGHPPNDVKFLYQMTQENGLPKGPNFDLKFYFGADKAGRDLFVRVLMAPGHH